MVFRSRSFSYGCLYYFLEGSSSLYLSTIYNYTKTCIQDKHRYYRQSNNYSAFLAFTVMVPLINLIDCIFSCQITKTQRLNQYAIDRTTTPANQESISCRSAVIRQSLIDKGISNESSTFIISSWRQGTTKQNNLCWKKLVLLCGGRVKNPITASEIDVVEYLIHLVDINSSCVHIHITNTNIAIFGASWCNNPTLIPRFIKCFFDIKPLPYKPKLTWDVSKVLHFISTLLPLESLNLKILI